MPIIRKALNNPCCDENMTQYSINSDGTASVSTDGGATFHDLPDNGSPLDPSTYFPPVAGESVEEIRCKAANSVTGWYKLLYQQYVDALAADVNELALAAIFQGVLLLVGVGAFTVWAAVGTTLALIVAKKNHDDFVAEFTDDFWNLLCQRAYCDVDAAGVYINTDPRQIIDEVTTASPGYAAQWLNAGMGTLNGRDLTNIGASGFDAGIDCSGFDCGGCHEDDWQLYDGTHGENRTTGTDDLGEFIRVDATNTPGGGSAYFVILTTHPGSLSGDGAHCCSINHIVVEENASDTATFVSPCGGTLFGSLVNYATTSDTCFDWIQVQSNTLPFTVRIYLGDPCT